MLRIYEVALSVVRDVREPIAQIGRFDRDLARQLRRASMSCVLNIAEGAGVSGGRRRLRYEDALGSARETWAGLEAAAAAGYMAPVSAEVRGRFDHIIGVLVRVVART